MGWGEGEWGEQEEMVRRQRDKLGLLKSSRAFSQYLGADRELSPLKK